MDNDGWSFDASAIYDERDDEQDEQYERDEYDEYEQDDE